MEKRQRSNSDSSVSSTSSKDESREQKRAMYGNNSNAMFDPEVYAESMLIDVFARKSEPPLDAGVFARIIPKHPDAPVRASLFYTALFKEGNPSSSSSDEATRVSFVIFTTSDNLLLRHTVHRTTPSLKYQVDMTFFCNGHVDVVEKEDAEVTRRTTYEEVDILSESFCHVLVEMGGAIRRLEIEIPASI